MKSTPLGLLAVALALAGCKQPARKPPAADRVAQCRQLFSSSAGGVYMAMQSMSPVHREQIERFRVGGLRECLSRLPGLPGACLDSREPARLKADLEAAVALCAGWDDELFECMREQDVGPACTTAYDRLRDLVDNRERPPGPGVRWHTRLPSPARDAHLLPDGRVLVAHGTQVMALKDGRSLWNAEPPGGGLGWLLPLAPEGVLTADRQGQVSLLSLEDGQPRWRRAVPWPEKPLPLDPARIPAEFTPPATVDADGRPAGDLEVPHPLAQRAVLDGPQVLLGLSNGRTARLDLATCAEREPGCFRAAERMFVSDLGGFLHWETARSGVRLVAVSHELVLIERTGEERMRLELDEWDQLGPPAAGPEGEFVLAGRYGPHDGRVLALAPEACRADEPRALPSPDEPEELDDFPPGCLAWQLVLPDLTAQRPIPLEAGQGVLVVAAGQGLVLRVERGRIVWRTRLDALAVAAGPGERAWVLTATPSLVELDTATGRARWESPLANAARSEQFESWPSLQVEGRRVLAVDGLELNLFELPDASEAGP
jgi:outer membrane protein assembly factor BamB